MATTTLEPTPGGFAHLPVQTDLAVLEAEVAILGVPYGVPLGLVPGARDDSAAAPAAIRAESRRFGDTRGHHDFDLGGTLLAGQDVRIVDCGDVPGAPDDHRGNGRRTAAAVRAIRERGAVPVVFGGDDSIPIPFFRAYEGRGPLSVVQIDAHIDWRDEVNGVREGYSSTMRRASEMDWIAGIVQVGMRGVGSARPGEVDDALAYGATIIPAREVHDRGVEHVLGRVPDGGDYLITVDCDGLDPAVMPGVISPNPGGLTYHQVTNILHGLARKGRIAGFDLVELVPARDVNGVTALTAGRLALNLIGAMARSGQLGRR